MKTEKSLKSRALDYLARRDYSRWELKRKLAPYAEDEDELDALLDELDSYDIEVIEEINYRDITSDNKYYLDDGYIDIINPVSYDLYL